MTIFFEKMLMSLLLWILGFIDTIFELCGILSGTQAVNDDGTTLIDLFLNSDIITQIFLSLIVLGIIIAAICMATAIIKHAINLNGGERKPQSRIVGQGLVSVFATLIFASVMISGIALANTALVAINNTFQEYTGGYSIGDQIFIMSVEESYVVLGSKIDEETGETILIYLLDENDNPKKENGWSFGSVPDKFTIEGKNADDIFGTFNTNMIGLEKQESRSKPGIVNLGSFNFFVGYFSAIILLVVLAMSMLMLVKRLYDLVMLFLMLPLVAGTMPLDDGAKLKLWRETVMSKVILAYGTVFAINVFLIVMSILNKSIDFANTAIFRTAFLGTVFKVFLMLGGGLSINGGQILFARLFGTSAEESREMTQALRSAVGGTLAVGGAARGAAGLAKRLALGGTDKEGNKRQGLLQGATNLAGNALGGNAYRRAVTGASERMQRLGNALRGTVSSRHIGNSFGGQGGGSKMRGSEAFAGGAESMMAGNMSGGSDNKLMNNNGLIGMLSGKNPAAAQKREARVAELTKKSYNELADFAQSKAEQGVIIPPTPKFSTLGNKASQGSPDYNIADDRSPNMSFNARHTTVEMPKQIAEQNAQNKPRKSSNFYKPPTQKQQAKYDVAKQVNMKDAAKKIVNMTERGSNNKPIVTSSASKTASRIKSNKGGKK